jgi:hypothetical protein
VQLRALLLLVPWLWLVLVCHVPGATSQAQVLLQELMHQLALRVHQTCCLLGLGLQLARHLMTLLLQLQQLLPLLLLALLLPRPLLTD